MKNKKNSLIQETYDKYILPLYKPVSIVPVKGLGSYIWDVQGKKYIDFSGGIAVTAMGHCHPMLVEILRKQSGDLWHTGNIFINEPSTKLAQKLVEASFASHVFFANSGAEANEAALKIARYYAIKKYGIKKTKIISFINSFHGRTFFTVSVGGKLKYSDCFGPVPEDIVHLPFNNLNCFKKIVDDSVCAVILETIQGEGGVIPIDVLFIQEIYKLCQKYNVLLIIDEVQTGIGRTGTLFSYEQYNIKPDMLTLAKSLGGGFPISALLTNTKVSEIVKPGLHGSTYGGNLLACSVATSVLNFINNKKVLSGVNNRSKLFFEKLYNINCELNLFKEIRIKGLLIGIELIDELPINIFDIVHICIKEGVLVLSSSTNVIRLAPSLIISYDDIKLGISYLKKAFTKIKRLCDNF